MYRLMLTLRKLLVSGFVVSSFIAYVVRDRGQNSAASASDRFPVDEGAHVQVVTPSQSILPNVQQSVPTSQRLTPSSTPSTPIETPLVPTATDEPGSQYQDGVYAGPVVDAFYGLVQIQATIQNGRLADVQFLQYPNDRRTSQRINAIAMPYLTREAIQAQSAYVNIISGATLTSQAFAMSLYNALNQAAI